MVNDKALQQSVLEELDYEPSIDAAHIGVSVANGIVTLFGHASSYAEKVAAENAAWRVRGVKGIAQEIAVRLPFDKKTADDEIAKRALDILKWDTSIPVGRISTTVEQGVVTLHGNADWQYQRRAAEHAIRKLTGVTGVINQIRLTLSLHTADVKDKIEAAFRRHAESEAAGIRVDVADGKVTLTGKVHTWAERQVAQRAAWSAPGVREVEDRIVIA